MLRRYGSPKCGSNFSNAEDIDDVEEEDYYTPPPKSFITIAMSGLALPVTVSRDINHKLPNTTENKKIKNFQYIFSR